MSDGVVTLEGTGAALRDSMVVDCENSGTTIRLLMGILAAVKGRFTLVGLRNPRALHVVV